MRDLEKHMNKWGLQLHDYDDESAIFYNGSMIITVGIGYQLMEVKNE